MGGAHTAADLTQNKELSERDSWVIQGLLLLTVIQEVMPLMHSCVCALACLVGFGPSGSQRLGSLHSPEPGISSVTIAFLVRKHCKTAFSQVFLSER